MNRHQRRTLGSRVGRDHFAPKVSPKPPQFRAAELEEGDPSTPAFLVTLRPMTMADMIPGVTYTPGTTLVLLARAPAPGIEGELWEIPLSLPAELREPTPENISAALERVYALSPEAREIVTKMGRLSRPWSEVSESFERLRERARSVLKSSIR